MSYASGQRGLLLAMMEPPPAMEEEFQDWYDTEHFPERATCEGSDRRPAARADEIVIAGPGAVSHDGNRK